MIGLGLRLLFQSGREALWRLSAIVAGVMLGTALLLSIVSGFTALRERDVHSGWRETQGTPLADTADTDNSLLWRRSADVVAGKMIDRFDVAGGSGQAIPGIAALPQPGEYYVSPALAEILRSRPANELADRFGTKQAGVIQKDGLGTANELIVVSGQKPDVLRGVPGTTAVTTVNGVASSPDSDFFKVILGVGAAGIIFPAAMFVAVSTRLAAARREERYAAIRLAGGTRRQIMGLAAIETGAGAVLGVALGFLLFMPVPHIVANFEMVGMQFYPEYVHVTMPQALLVSGGVLATAFAIAFAALRKIDISPLGIARKASAKPPRLWRILPLLLGLGAVVYMAFGDGGTANEATMIISFLMCGIGIFLAGPLLATGIARLTRRWSRGPASLIAGSRLLTRPYTIFRTVSGIVIAVFVVSVFNAIIYSLDRSGPSERQARLPQGTLTLLSSDEETPVDARKVAATAQSVAGIQGSVTLYDVPEDMQLKDVTLQTAAGKESLRPDLLLPCDSARQLGFETCNSGTFMAIPANALFQKQTPPEGWQYVTADAAGLAPSRLLFMTDGASSTTERLRTAFAKSPTNTLNIFTDDELYGLGVALVSQLRALAGIGILITLVIAGCGLLVSVADSLLERKRPFALLRLTGMRLAQLRATVLLEAAIPLIVTTVLAAGAGTLYGQLLLKAVSDMPLSFPPLNYVLTIVLGIAASLLIVAATLPLLNKLTLPENARFE